MSAALLVSGLQGTPETSLAPLCFATQVLPGLLQGSSLVFHPRPLPTASEES